VVTSWANPSTDWRDPQGEGADTPRQSAEFIPHCGALAVSVAPARSAHKRDAPPRTGIAQPSPRQPRMAPFASRAASTANVPAASEPAPPLVLVSGTVCGLGTNGGSRTVTGPQAELLLRSIIPKFPGPNMRQRKGSSICALPNTRRCKPRWQLPLCGTFSLFFSRCRKPSLVSDAECVFAVCVQRLEILFQNRDGNGRAIICVDC